MKHAALVLAGALLAGCSGSPTEPLPPAGRSQLYACPPGSTYYVPTQACVTPALCPPGYYFEAYAGCQLPTGPLPLAPTIEPPPAAAPEVQ